MSELQESVERIGLGGRVTQPIDRRKKGMIAYHEAGPRSFSHYCGKSDPIRRLRLRVAWHLAISGGRT